MPEGHTNMATDNGWDQYKRMWLDDREQRRIWEKRIDRRMNDIAIEITKLKMKSGIWGAIAGMIPVIFVLLYISLR